MNKERLLKYVKTIVLLLAFSLIMLTFSSCDMFGGGGENLIAPRLSESSPPRIERINPDYFNQHTNQEEIYKDPNEIMPVRAEESVYLVIEYNNQSNLSINRVVFSAGSQHYDVMANNFAPESNSDKTIIEFEIPNESPNTAVTYTIDSIYYNAGSRVLNMNLNPELVDIPVIVAPEFTITFDHQNYDQRTGEDKTSSEATINYYQELVDIIPDTSIYSTNPHFPEKAGGWSFRGYYTQPGGPDGVGIRVRNSENYYFWSDITLYAHFERLYQFEVVELEEPIPYEEDGDTLYYEYGAIAGRKTAAGDIQQNLEIYDTIADNEGVYPIIAIADAAFGNTSAMRTLTIGKYVKTIGKNAFDGSNVETVIFHPEGVLEKIDDEAFRGTSRMNNSFSLPETVTYIGDRAFQSSGWGGTLEIKPHLTHIGNWAFANTSFSTVIFKPGVKFKADAVKGENYVEQIGGDPVEADSDYYLGWALFKNSETIKTFRTETDSGEANGLEFLPAAMFDVALHNQDSNVGLTSVILAEGLKVIKKGAFRYQKLLTSITFPLSLEDLGGDAYINGPNQQFPGTSERSEYGVFEDCSSLSTVTFPENGMLRILGGAAFRNTNLTSVEIPSKNFEFYGDGPFQGCVNLSEIHFDFDDPENIPQPLTYQRAALSLRGPTADFFYSNESFKVFVNNEVVEGFRDSLEEGASPIIKRNMPVYSDNMIYEIGSHRMILEETTCALQFTDGWILAYYFGENNHIDLSAVPQIENKNIVEIGSYAFHKGVQTITLSGMITTLAPYAFSGCSSLYDVIFPTNNVVNIGEEAFFGSAITHYLGGQHLKKIGANAFQSCESLVWVDFKQSSHGRGAFVIEMSAFSRCSSLQYVRLPSNYTSMADGTFAYCSSLRYMIFENSTPLNDMFGNVSARFQSVPTGVITAYVMNETARGNYEALYPSLPQQLRNRFAVWSDPEITSPGPEDLLVLN